MFAANKKSNPRSAFASSRPQGNEKSTSNDVGLAPLNSKELHSSPTTINLRGTQVHFPFKPYQCQENYMTTVLDALHHEENALLESPTGTGKTLCLLCSTLAWQREQAAKLAEYPTAAVESSIAAASDPSSVDAIKPQAKVSTIIYASRTHSQLSQVVKELERTRYRPRHAVIGSREQMCIHPKINTAKATPSDINHGCTKLNKERKCRYRNNLDGFVSPQAEGGGQGFAIQPVLDIEDLRVLGKKRNICPFYFTRGHLQDAEIIFVPYNYLFDKDARTQSLAEVQWKNSVMIFDEAHNLESFASESASFDLSGVDIGGCINEVTRAIGYVQNMPEMTDGSVKLENLVSLKSIFLRFENYLDNELVPAGGSFSGEFIFEIFLKGMKLSHGSYAVFLKFVKQVSEMIMEIRGGNASSSSGTPKLDHFVGCIKKVFGTKTESQAYAQAKYYRVHVTPRTGKSSRSDSSNGGGFVGASNTGGRVLSYWCFSSCPSFYEFEDLGVRSILVTSGTLSPLPSYSLELGIPFPHTLENSHVISEEQIAVRVIGKGVTGKSLSSSYNRRDDVEYITELGNTIVSLVRIIPGGVLIFFPSYKSMEKCLEQWGAPFSQRQNYAKKTSKKNFFQARSTPSNTRYVFPRMACNSTASKASLWSRLLSAKAVLIEPKTTAELKDVMQEFDKFISMPKSTGCILMGVCRGKISEGIDFADDRCRAVIITGIPYAPYLDPKVKLKREYLDSVKASHAIKASKDGGFSSGQNTKSESQSDALSGAEWYSQQAHRAVNQAIGRVIRHRSDYGGILLLDERFGETRNQLGLSKWVRPRIESDSRIGSTIGSLVKFYRQAAKVTAESKLSLDGKKKAIRIKYENDDKPVAAQITDEKVTKVAVIKRNSLPPVTAASDASENIQSYVKPEAVAKRFDLKNVGNNHNEVSKSSMPPKRMVPLASRERRVSTELTGLYAISDTISSAYGKKGQSAPVSQQRGQRDKAKQFFDSAKRCLSQNDFTSTRELLVRMKSSGDSQDSRSYMNAAKELLKILLRYDEGCVHDDRDRLQLFDGETMLGLLYELLPVTYRSRIKTIACKMRFHMSCLYQYCKKCLSSEDQEHLKKTFPSIMMESGDDGGDERTYLVKVERVLKFLTKGTATDSSNLLDAMKLLIPENKRSAVNLMINEFATQQRIKNLKASTKMKRGEASIETALFRRPTVKDYSLSAGKAEEKSFSDERSKFKRQAEPLGKLGKDHTSTRPNKAFKSEVSTPMKRPSSKPGNDSIDRCLSVAKKQVYGMSTPLHERIKSRICDFAPNDMGCEICQDKSVTPCMAACGHVACLQCWTRWLERSGSCPKCRRPCKTEELEKLLYAPGSQSGAKSNTLTQMLQDSDEEELEIC